MVLRSPMVFDWEEYRKLSEDERTLWKLALEQWFNGHDPETREDRGFSEGFRAGWLACKAVEKSV